MQDKLDFLSLRDINILPLYICEPEELDMFDALQQTFLLALLDYSNLPDSLSMDDVIQLWPYSKIPGNFAPYIYGVALIFVQLKVGVLINVEWDPKFMSTVYIEDMKDFVHCHRGEFYQVFGMFASHD